MGRGDKKTKKGKIKSSSYGNSRPKTKTKTPEKTADKKAK